MANHRSQVSGTRHQISYPDPGLIARVFANAAGRWSAGRQRAENRIHGSEQLSCSSGAPPVMIMCLRFVFLLITRLAAWLRPSRREETWKTAEILILRHQLAVLQRRQPRRPRLNWADRARLAALLGVIPNARHHRLRPPVTPDTILRWHRDTVRRPLGAAVDPRQDRPTGHPPEHQGPGPSGWPGRTPNRATAGSTGNWPGWGQGRGADRTGDPQDQRHRPRAAADRPTWPQFLRSQADAILACDFGLEHARIAEQFHDGVRVAAQPPDLRRRRGTRHPRVGRRSEQCDAGVGQMVCIPAGDEAAVHAYYIWPPQPGCGMTAACRFGY